MSEPATTAPSGGAAARESAGGERGPAAGAQRGLAAGAQRGPAARPVPAGRERGVVARDLAGLEIRDGRGAELIAGCALVARALAFSERDALPPWLVQTAAGCGGLALGAFAGGRLVGFSFALLASERSLFSCGLAVEPELRGRGVGRRLKLAQRDRALEQGCTRIVWTADPLSAPALALYLSGLGARLVGYEPELYAAVRPSPVPPDDVVIEWRLDAAPPESDPAARVEIPYDRRALAPSALLEWRLRVRAEMTRALEAGAAGTGVAADRETRRAWVLFSA